MILRGGENPKEVTKGLKRNARKGKRKEDRKNGGCEENKDGKKKKERKKVGKIGWKERRKEGIN